jgi:hypothetical protein
VPESDRDDREEKYRHDRRAARCTRNAGATDR